jgi:hypothetical protein
MNLRYDLVKGIWIEILAQILTIGADKHKSDEFETKSEEEYFRSAMGHIVADMKGVQYDPEDNMPSLAKAACNLLIIHYKRLYGKNKMGNNKRKCPAGSR